MSEFRNKVAESGIITIDLATYFPTESIQLFDLKDYLFMGLILKEKDFRDALKNLDTSMYANSIVALTCSADAIIPIWAYMLVASLLQPIANEIFYAAEDTVRNMLLLRKISSIDLEEFNGQRVVIKGCGEIPVPEEAYVAITTRLRPLVKSIMYGEPCSTVPVFKKERAAVT